MKTMTMNRIETKRSDEGSVLIMVMGVVVLTSLLAGTMMLAGNNHYRNTSRQADLEMALYVAEAGMEIAADYLAEQQGFIGTSYSSSGTIDGHPYNYVMTKVGWRTYTMEAVGTVGEISRKINIDRVYLPTYAKYALWMDLNGVIYFTPGEQFDGHVHSNDTLWFSGNSNIGGPEFWEKVTSAQSSFAGSPQHATFHKGYELNASEGQMSSIDFDSTSSSSLRNLADSFGRRIRGDAEFYFSGQDVWIREDGRWDLHRVQEDQLIYVDGYSTVHGGVVDGRMTIVSENDIWIEDHIRYADDPRDDTENSQSDDALGLISRDDVWISTSAPDDLEIFASILAAGTRGSNNGQYNDGSFGVSQYNSSYYGHRGDLTVYGGIVQEVRGAVGTFRHGYGGVTGYNKDYHFDPRFGQEPPPYYPPVSDKVEFEDWSEEPA